MQFLVENMSTRELRPWIAHRLKLLQPSRIQAKGVFGQAMNMEEQRKELAFMCRHVMSVWRPKGRNEGDGSFPRPDDSTFRSALEQLVRATLVARQVSLFGSAVRQYPSKLSQKLWRKVGEEFKDDDVLYGEYKDR